MNKLNDKVAVITGGTTGIGLATARLFAAEGAKVTVTGRNPSTLAVAERELAGSGVRVVASDATKVADLDRLFADVRQRHGRLDVLFVNAGGGTFRPLEAADEAFFDEIIALNLKSAYFTIQKAAPPAPRGASIVLSSVVNQKGFPNVDLRCGEGGVAPARAQPRRRARARRRAGERVVSPGPIDTPIYDKLGLGEGKAGFLAQMEASVPMKRFGRAEEVARAALFLASDDASYVTGDELMVDGGLTSF
ncbi:MAG: SDR family oxidoreductase [Polyangiaceae bacterium]